MSDELKDILEASDRYKKFTLPDKPACFTVNISEFIRKIKNK